MKLPRECIMPKEAFKRFRRGIKAREREILRCNNKIKRETNQKVNNHDLS